MSTDYSFYALLCGFMPRPEGVQKRRTRVLLFFFVFTRARTLDAPPFQGGWEGVNFRAHDCAPASSAVEPLRGYRREERELFSFFCSIVDCVVGDARVVERSSYFVQAVRVSLLTDATVCTKLATELLLYLQKKEEDRSSSLSG